MNQAEKKALVLFSGGLDSVLSVFLTREAGAAVRGIKFTTPFFDAERALKTASEIGIDLLVVDFFEEHLKIVRAPRFGYGKNLNPCLDCHILMIRKSFEMLSELGCDFLVTGEVLGERPKSQTRQALKTVDSQTGTQGLLVRPLSAKLMEPTIPELEGWVDREKFCDISGRSRKMQLELAEKYKISDFETPAGGCLLTDPIFSERFSKIVHSPDLSRRDIELLKYGRHFFIAGFHFVISRNRDENCMLPEWKQEEDVFIRVYEKSSPLCLVLNGKSAPNSILEQIAALVLRYSRFRDEKNIEMTVGENVIVIGSSISENLFERI